MAYQEKRAHAINEEMHGWTNGGEEGLDDHIAALCSKLSKDQIAFLEQQWDQFYREASEEDLDGDDVKYRLHRYEELGQSHDFNIDDYSEQQKRIFADCGLCSTWDDGSSRSGSNYSDSECDAFDNGAHAVDSSFLRWQQQRQLQSQQRQGSLQSMIERPPQVITMPGPGQKIPCIGNRPTNGSNEDGSLDSGGGLTAGSAFATASAPAPTPAPALPSTSETASDSAPAPTPALVSDSEEETPPVSDSEEETSLTGRKHFYGRTKRTKGTARRTQEPKTTVDSELNRARDIWLMGRVSKWEYHHFCNQVHTYQQLLKEGSIHSEGFQRSIEILMEQLVRNTHWRKARSSQKQSPNNKGREPHGPPGKCQPEPKPRMHGIYRRGKKGGHTEMEIYGGVKVRKHYNRWQRSRRRRWDSILNVKRSAESVAEGAAQVTLTTQRMMPAPKRKKKRRRISRLPIAGA